MDDFLQGHPQPAPWRPAVGLVTVAALPALLGFTSGRRWPCASHARRHWDSHPHLPCTLAAMPVGFALTGVKPTGGRSCWGSSRAPRP